MPTVEQKSLECPDCHCKWFEQFDVTQYSDIDASIVGQKPTALQTSAVFTFLRCLQCNRVIEPKVYRMANDSLNILYDKVLDCLDKRNIKREINSLNQQVITLPPLVEHKETGIPPLPTVNINGELL